MRYLILIALVVSGCASAKKTPVIMSCKQETMSANVEGVVLIHRCKYINDIYVETSASGAKCITLGNGAMHCVD